MSVTEKAVVSEENIIEQEPVSLSEEQELEKIIFGEEKVEEPVVNEPEKPAEEIFEIEGNKLTKAEIKAMLDNQLNSSAWKKKLEDRGRVLNEAERIHKRIQEDPRFKAYIESFEDERFVALKDEYGPDVAKRIRELETKNIELETKYKIDEAENALKNEEKTLMEEGATREEVEKAYEIAIAENANRIKLGVPRMSLTEAMVKVAASGGLKGMIERIKEEATKEALEKLKTNQKSNLPTKIGGSVAASSKPKHDVKIDSDEDDYEFMLNNPEFAGVRRK